MITMTPPRAEDASVVAALSAPRSPGFIWPTERQAPIVIFCKSHSGSRLAVRLLDAAGVFMGAHRSESGDSWDVLPIVRYLVTRYYPDYAAVLRGEDPLLAAMMAAAFRRHLAGYDPAAAQGWGWKVCETTFILPVVSQIFPNARFIHLIRDGRDTAFADHTGPTDAFWRKVFFDRPDIASWQGMPLTGAAYRRHPHLFNAQHWLNSVTLGHAAALDLGGRCLELRYEDLCRDPTASAARLFDFLGLPASATALAPIHSNSVGRFRRQPRHEIRAVLRLIAPLQAALGYPIEER